jgi:hypothetical protein
VSAVVVKTEAVATVGVPDSGLGVRIRWPLGQGLMLELVGAHTLWLLAAKLVATATGARANNDGQWRPRRAAVSRELWSQVQLCVAWSEGVAADAAGWLLHATGALMPL